MIVSETVREWQAEARVEAELTTKRSAIRTILRARFQQTPVELTPQLESLPDLQLLDELIILAATAVDLNAFLSEFKNRT